METKLQAQSTSRAPLTDMYNLVDDGSDSKHMLGKTGGENETSTDLCLYDEYSVPKHLRMATFPKQLFYHNVSKENTSQFAVDDIVVEYLPGGMVPGETNFYYTYFSGHASVGMPTETYNWILSKLETASGYKLDNSFVTNKSSGYTWMVAEIMLDPGCHECSRAVQDLVYGGSQNVVTENMIGVGYFYVSLRKDHDNKYLLDFTLKKFHSKGRTQKSCRSSSI